MYIYHFHLHHLTEFECVMTWTGGWTHGLDVNDNPEAWRWYYTNDVIDGPSDPFTYVQWASNEPNALLGHEPALGLLYIEAFQLDNDFIDVGASYAAPDTCFLCEYP